MPTQAEIEAVAKVLCDVPPFMWPKLSEDEQSRWRSKAMAALAAAERVRGEEWIDVPISPDYEIQLHRDKRRYRHRQRSARSDRGGILEFSWIDGPPPSCSRTNEERQPR